MRLKINFFHARENSFPEIIKMIFRVSFAGFIVFFILDYIYPGFVTNWFNPIWLLFISIVSGLASVIDLED